METHNSPLFSFVATSRNDDHGGDVLRRTQSFVDRLAQQAQRHSVRCELVLVDWNPPEPRAPLGDVLNWPAGNAYFSARVVTVPREIHRAMRHSRALQMFQMVAKNVGIRRASGEYIIATNIDIIFSDQLFSFLKTETLDKKTLYRSDRWDIPNEIQLEPDLSTLLRRAQAEAIRRNLGDGTYVRQDDGGFKNCTPPHHESFVVEPMRWSLDRLIDWLREPGREQSAIRERVESIRQDFLEEQARYASAPLLHTNGCGDFTMLSRYGWGRLRGYPEWHLFSWAIDSVLLYQAHYNGMPIVELPADAVHFHIEHDHGSGWSPEGASSLWQRLDAAGTPYLESDDFRRLVFELQDNAAAGHDTVYSPLDWGFSNYELPEELVAAPGMPRRMARTANDGRLVEDWTVGLRRTALPIERARHHPVAASFAPVYGGQNVYHRLTTEGAPWGYALSWDLGTLDREDEFWLEVRAQVHGGEIGFGILNQDESEFVVQAMLYQKPASQCVTIRVSPNARAGTLVCRNGDKTQASVDLEQISLLELATVDR
jgi:hypothetical protein